MKLSEVVKSYRERMGLSQRKFSEKCNLSNTYIYYIEIEKNPKTGKPIVPTIEQYKKLANAMDMTLNQLWDLLDDDILANLSEPFSGNDFLSDDEHKLIDAWRAADDRAREDAMKTLLNHPREKENSAAV